MSARCLTVLVALLASCIALCPPSLRGDEVQQFSADPVPAGMSSLYGNERDSYHFWVSKSGRCPDRNTPELPPNEAVVSTWVDGLRPQQTADRTWYDWSEFNLGTHGLYGAGRGGRPHKGLDIPWYPGFPVFAPETGFFQFSIQVDHNEPGIEYPPEVNCASLAAVETATPHSIRPRFCRDLKGPVNSLAGWMVAFDPDQDSAFRIHTTLQHIEQWSVPEVEFTYTQRFRAEAGDIVAQASLTGNAGAKCNRTAEINYTGENLNSYFRAGENSFERGGPHVHVKVGYDGVAPYKYFTGTTSWDSGKLTPLAGVIEGAPGLSEPRIYDRPPYVIDLGAAGKRLEFPRGLPVKVGGTVEIYYELSDFYFFVDRVKWTVDRTVAKWIGGHLRRVEGPTPIDLEHKVHELEPVYYKGHKGPPRYHYFPEWKITNLWSVWMGRDAAGEKIDPPLHKLDSMKDVKLGFNADAVPSLRFKTEGTSDHCHNSLITYDVRADVRSAAGVTRTFYPAIVSFSERKRADCTDVPNEFPDETLDLSSGHPESSIALAASEDLIAREVAARGHKTYTNGYSAGLRIAAVNSAWDAYLESLPDETEETMGDEEGVSEENSPEQWRYLTANNEASSANLSGRNERSIQAERLLPIKVLDQGRTTAMRALLESQGIVSTLIEEASPLDPGVDVLVIPTGGLAGIWQSPSIRDWLGEFVSAGGSLAVLDQQHGKHYSVLPRGDEIDAFGWDEIQACYANAARIEADHPALAAVPGALGSPINVGVDGYFKNLPEDAEVLLRSSGTDYAVLAIYPVGVGRVAVATLFEDDAKSRGMSSKEGVSILRDLVQWLRKPIELPTYAVAASGVIDVTREVRVWNLTQWPATKAKLLWSAPNGAVVHEETQALSLSPGEEALVASTWGLPQPAAAGVWFVDYALEDDEWPVQVRSLDSDSRFIVAVDRAATGGASAKVLAWVTVPSESASPVAPLPVTLHVRNLTSSPYQATGITWRWWENDHFGHGFRDTGSMDGFSVAPGEEVTRTLEFTFPSNAIVEFFLTGANPAYLHALKGVHLEQPYMDLQIAWPETLVSGAPATVPYTVSNPTGNAFTGELRVFHRYFEQPLLVIPLQIPAAGSVGGDLAFQPHAWEGQGQLWAEVRYQSVFGPSVVETNYGSVLFRRSTLVGERLPVSVGPAGKPLVGVRLSVPADGVGMASGTVTLSARTFGPNVSQSFPIELLPGGSSEFRIEVPFDIPALSRLNLEWSEVDETRIGFEVGDTYHYTKQVTLALTPVAQQVTIGSTVNLGGGVSIGEFPFDGTLELRGPVGIEASFPVTLPAGGSQSLTVPVIIPPAALLSSDRKVTYDWSLADTSGARVARSQTVSVSPLDLALTLAVPVGGWRAGTPSSTSLSITNNATHFADIPVDLEIFVPGLGVLATASSAIPATGDSTIPLTLTLPLSDEDETYEVTTRIRLGGTSRYLYFGYSTARTYAARCEIVLQSVPDPILAGGVVGLEIQNRSSSDLDTTTSWTLTSNRGEAVASGALVGTIAFGGAADLSIQVPAQLSSGSYFLSVKVTSTTSQMELASRIIAIDALGDEAALQVLASASSYVASQPVSLSAQLVAGAQGLSAGAALDLKVVRLAPVASDGGFAPCLYGEILDAERGFSGEAWVVLGQDLARLEPETCGEPQNFAAGEVLQTLARGVGADIWVASNASIRRFDGAVLGAPTALPPAPEQVVNLERAPDGTLWVARLGASELTEVFNGTAAVVAGPSIAPIASLKVAPDGRVFVVSSDSLWERGGGAWQDRVPPPLSPGPNAGSHQIAVTADGDVWVAGRVDVEGSGPTVFKLGSATHTWTEHALPFWYTNNCHSGSFGALGIDADDNLLVAISYVCDPPGTLVETTLDVTNGVDLFLGDEAGFRNIGSLTVTNISSVAWRLFGTPGDWVWFSDGEQIASSFTGTNEVAWQRTDVLPVVSPGEEYPVSEGIPGGFEAGEYVLRGTVAFGELAPLAESEFPFTIHAADVEVHLSSAAPGAVAAIPGSVAFTGSVRNASAVSLQNVEIRVRTVNPSGDESLLASQVVGELLPGQQAEVPASLSVSEEGRYTVLAEAWMNPGEVLLGQQMVHQVTVAATVGLAVAPPVEVVEGVSAIVDVDAANASEAAVSVSARLLPEDSSRPPVSLVLGAREVKRVSLAVGLLPASGDFVVELVGQATAQTPVPIVRAGLATLSAGVGLEYQEGTIVVPILLENRGAPFGFSLEWNLDGAQTGAASGSLSRDAVWEGSATFNMSPGAHLITVTRVGSDPVSYPINVVARDWAEIVSATAAPPEEGIVAVQALVRNPSPFAEQLEVITRVVAPDASVTELREPVEIDGGQELSLTFPFELGSGLHQFTLLAGSVSSSWALDIGRRVDATLEVTIADRGPGFATVRAAVTNTGTDSWSGELVGSGVASGSRASLGVVAPGGTTAVEWPLDLLGLSAGDHPVGASLLVAGSGIEAAGLDLTVLPPAISLVALVVPAQLNAGDIATLEATLANSGDVPAQVVFDVDGGGLGKSSVTVDVEPASAGDFAQVLAIPANLVSGTYSVGYLIRTLEGTIVASGSRSFVVDGWEIAIDASLDQATYAEGEPVAADFTITASGPHLGQGFELRVAYDDQAASYPLDISSGQASVSASLAAAAGASKLAFGLYDADGLGMLLDARYVRVGTAALRASTDRDRYRPGETVSVTVEVSEPGTLKAYFFDDEFQQEVSGTTVLTFVVPPDEPTQTAPISLHLESASGEVADLSVPIDIDGLRVRVLDQRFDRTSFESGDSVVAIVTLLASAGQQVSIEGTLVDPEGGEFALPVAFAQLYADERTVVSLSYPLSGTIPGLYRLSLAVVDEADNAQAGAGTLLEYHLPALVRAELDSSADVQSGESPRLLYTAIGNGSATLEVVLDGTLIYSETINLSGFFTGSVLLASIPSGYHEGEIALQAAHRSALPLRLQLGQAPMSSPPGPDLVIAGSQLRVLALSNGSLEVYGEMSNLGDQEAGASVVRLVASALAGEPFEIARISVGPLGAGLSAPFSVEWNPAGFEGDTRITAVADVDAQVDEVAEWNNEGSGIASLSSLHVAVSASPSSIAANETATLSVSALNRSSVTLENVSVTLQIYGSGGVVGGSASWLIPTLLPGQAFADSYLFASQLKPPGAYQCFVMAKANGGLVQTESTLITITPTEGFSGSLDVTESSVDAITLAYSVQSFSNIFVNIGDLVLDVYDQGSGWLATRVPLGGWLPPGEQVSLAETHGVALEEGTYEGRLTVLGELVATDSFVVQVIPLIFADGFEAGDIENWSAHAP